jgi:hypothetical protein
MEIREDLQFLKEIYWRLWPMGVAISKYANDFNADMEDICHEIKKSGAFPGLGSRFELL